MYKKIAAVAVAGLFSTAALAGANCAKHPKSEWMPEADAKAKIAAQGYNIKKFKIDGNCYEIYGTTKDGKKAEIYFDTKTLDIVKSEIEK
ncbi:MULTISPECIES: PepSY domain-containing protein [Cupriavidus]|uniref:PepSY domain-containing protein n=1 Tax=Cupriavidus pauculus TaxID=82633 RepID=A0A3G8H5U3_9BURK|nr:MULTISPECIES: PepSY domain-containing protein [Cupriavidus]AZG15897.1 PepSY domain-containing protein [Cupriavidus pauculus]MDT6963621.1 PepSY domain-containing protein [Cupriavidus sp. SZY C1]